MTEGSRRVPLDRAASFDEIIRAIDALTPEQSKRLELFARHRTGQLGTTNLDGDAEDLLQQAMTSLLSGDRRWNPKNVDLVKFLIGAMQSISHNQVRRNAEKETALEADVIQIQSDGSEINPMLEATARHLDGRVEQKAKQDLELIESLVANRERAAFVLMLFQDGLSGSEIQSELEITGTEHETEMKWIRRTIRQAFGREK